MGPIIECAVHAMIAWNGFPQVIRLTRVSGLLGLLRAIARAAEIAIPDPRRNLVALNCEQGRSTHE